LRELDYSVARRAAPHQDKFVDFVLAERALSYVCESFAALPYSVSLAWCVLLGRHVIVIYRLDLSWRLPDSFCCFKEQLLVHLYKYIFRQREHFAVTLSKFSRFEVV